MSRPILWLCVAVAIGLPKLANAQVIFNTDFSGLPNNQEMVPRGEQRLVQGTATDGTTAAVIGSHAVGNDGTASLSIDTADGSIGFTLDGDPGNTASVSFGIAPATPFLSVTGPFEISLGYTKVGTAAIPFNLTLFVSGIPTNFGDDEIPAAPAGTEERMITFGYDFPSGPRQSVQAIEVDFLAVTESPVGLRLHSFAVTAVPEPNSFVSLLIGAGMFGWGITRRRNRRDFNPTFGPIQPTSVVLTNSILQLEE